jgi:hypothetical protein
MAGTKIDRRGIRRAHLVSVLESLESRVLLAETFTVINTDDAGAGSLRQAILDANGAAGADAIEFDIPGGGVHTISPASELPAITEELTINGYTQTGASANTLANGSDAVLLIELDGTNAGVGSRGLIIDSSDVTVRGLVINRFAFGIQASAGTANHVIAGNFFGTNAAGTASAGGFQGVGIHLNSAGDSTVGGTSPADRNLFAGYGSGLQIQDSAGNTVQGNYFGTNAAGTAAISSSSIRVTSFTDGSSDNLIGGTAAGAGNLIAGNSSGIVITGGGQDNTIQGNFIGTDATGLAALGGAGIFASDTRNLLIGGTAAGAANVISGNQSTGVSLTATTANVRGNLIGVGADGTTAVANTASGIHIAAGTGAVTIGGTGAGQPNVIANNANFGISLASGSGGGHTILSNSIYNNGVLGIDLLADGSTANDEDDPDTGPNNLQNFPVLSPIRIGQEIGPANTTIGGTLNSTPNTDFTVQLFASDNFNFAGIGQGRTLLATLSVSTDGNGDATFSTDLPNATVPKGTLITATATNDATGDTSEFSRIVAVGAFVVTNTATSGAGSIDNAIKGANIVPGTDNVHFDIPGSGVHTIEIQGLYQITDPVVIDGYTQPGASPNTLANGNDAVLLIELSGQHNYFANITGGGTTVRGLVMNSWSGIAAFIVTGPAGGNIFEGNFIGTQPDGETLEFTNSAGIQVEGSPNNRFGGPSPAQRNLFAGNGTGIQFFSGNPDRSLEGNVIQGNYFGTNADGTAAIQEDSPNAGGITIQVSNEVPTDILIGGSEAGAGNLFSGLWYGLTVSGFGSEPTVRIQGNKIGTDPTGTQDIGNEIFGIGVGGLDNTTSNVTIGGPNPGEGNIIAFNGADAEFGAGIVLGQNGPSFAVGTVIQGNSIFGNKSTTGAGLGIDIGGDGPTANDAGDTDAGPNNKQNYPVITSATESGPNVDIGATLDSTPNTTFHVEFFSTSANGQTFLGSADVTTDGAGNATINESFPGSIPTGGGVVATATDPNGNTSEFTPLELDPVGDQPDLTADPADAPLSVQQGGTASLPVTVSNGGLAVANGPFEVRVFASLDGTLDTNTDTLLGTTIVNQDVPSGGDRNADTTLNVPAILPVGDYTLFVFVDAANAVAEVNEINNTTPGPTLSVTAGPGPGGIQFGRQSPSGKTQVTLTDADQTRVTFRLIGPGVGTVTGGNGAQAFDLALTGTDATSKLVILTQGGDGQVVLSSVTADGQASLKSFVGKTTDLAGNFNLPGVLASLVLDDVLTPGDAPDHLLTIGGAGATEKSKLKIKLDDAGDIDVTSGVLIANLTVDEWAQDVTNNDPDLITAPAIKVIKARGDKKNFNRGDFEAGLNLTDPAQKLKKLTVKGLLANLVIRTAGDVGAIVAGAVRDATVFVGVDPNAPEGTLPGSAQIGTRTLKAFTVKGKPEDFGELGGSLVSDLNLAAANLGSVKLKLVDTASGDGTFGIATQKIKSYRRDNIRLANPPLGANPDLDAQGNFVLRLLA